MFSKILLICALFVAAAYSKPLVAPLLAEPSFAVASPYAAYSAPYVAAAYTASPYAAAYTAASPYAYSAYPYAATYGSYFL